MSEPGKETPPQAPAPSGWDANAPLELRPRPKRNEESFSFGAGVWVVIVICAIAVTGLARLRGELGNGAVLPGSILGSFVGVALLAYLVGWVLYRMSGRSLAVGRAAAVVIAFLAVLGGLGKTGQVAQVQANQAELARELRNDLAQVAGDGQTSQPIRPIDVQATVAGEHGELQVFVKQHLNRMIAVHNEYLAALDAAGWNDVLDPQRLQAEGGLDEAQAAVGRAKAIVASFRKRNEDAIAQTEQAVRSMDTRRPTTRGFANGFLASVGAAKAEQATMWELEAACVASVGDLVDFLDSHRQDWVVDAGQFVFSDEATLAGFNELLGRVNGLIDRQEQLRRAANQKADATLGSMERG